MALTPPSERHACCPFTDWLERGGRRSVSRWVRVMETDRVEIIALLNTPRPGLDNLASGGAAMDQDAGQNVVQYLHFQITSAVQFRAALARLRFLEGAKANGPAGREREALELAVSRYLTRLEAEKTTR